MRRGGRGRTVTFIAVIVRVSTIALRIAPFPSGFTGSRTRTVRSWRILIAEPDSCEVEEQLVVALQQVLDVTSEKGAVIVNRCGG